MIKDALKVLVLEEGLGNEIESIARVIGGLSHRMYKVVTDKGIYAIKELNPGVMKRPEAYSNFVFSEQIAEIAKENGIDLVGAIKLKGNEVIKKVAKYYFMVFPWIEGRILKADEITKKRAEMIGEILAQIHNIDFSAIEDESRKEIDIEEFSWRKYAEEAEQKNKPYSMELKQNLDFLYEINQKANVALKYAKRNLVISHTDLDRKNVMWQSGKPIIIDWEASGYINPTIELIQVAWYWSGGDSHNIDYDKFVAVIETYKKRSKIQIDSNIDILIYADIYGGLGWLDYNLKRSLCIGNNYEQDEIELAENEVIQSIREIKYNISQINNMLNILKIYF